MVLLGHYHHFYSEESNDMNVVVNGSIVGCDPYANKLRLKSEPMQVLIVFDDKGDEICIYKVKLK